MKKLSLADEIVIVLIVKICALALLWYCFFSTPTEAPQQANHILGENNQ